MTNKDYIKESMEDLKKLLNVKNFIGEPIETEDKLLIPFMKVGFGFGGAKAKNEDNKGNFFGGGAGVEPISMVVINKETGSSEGIKVLNLSEGTETNKIISDLGLVVTDLIKEVINNMTNSGQPVYKTDESEEAYHAEESEVVENNEKE